MKVIITGGGGFLGSQLAKALHRTETLVNSVGEEMEIEEMILVDQAFPEDKAIAKTRLVKGSVADPEVVAQCIPSGEANLSVFHLASMVSGECEVRFDDALHANLDGIRLWLDALRNAPGTPKMVFTSSVAAFGGAAMPERVGDSTKRNPQTTYGMTKVISELLINDYSRKGFIDGRGARLPTVIIRPGKPNTAASSFASGIFRERLNGAPCHLPVDRGQIMPVIGFRTVINSLIGLHELSPSVLDDDRTFTLPSQDLSVEEMTSILEKTAHERGITLGPLVDDPDPIIQKIVSGWPIRTYSERALEAGLPDVDSIETIIAQYLEEFGENIG